MVSVLYPVIVILRLWHSRIRENGLSVYGFGKKTTPEAF